MYVPVKWHIQFRTLIRLHTTIKELIRFLFNLYVSTVITCPDRANPINGTSIRLAANLVDFSCDLGFNLNDPILGISLCEPTTGLWSGPVPSCISKCACRAVSLSMYSGYKYTLHYCHCRHPRGPKNLHGMC